jgi:hypothetical protein
LIVAAILILPAYRATAQQTAKREPTIAFSTRPSPVLLGQNRFHVALTRPGGVPVAGAEVTVLLVMPPQPEIKHPEMRSEVKLKELGKGHYEGVGLVTMAGKWNVVVRAMQQGKVLAEKKLTIATK